MYTTTTAAGHILPYGRIQKAKLIQQLKNKTDFNMTLIWATITEIFNAICKWCTWRYMITGDRGLWPCLLLDVTFTFWGAECVWEIQWFEGFLIFSFTIHTLLLFPLLAFPVQLQSRHCHINVCKQNQPNSTVLQYDKPEENLSATFPLIWYS